MDEQLALAVEDQDVGGPVDESLLPHDPAGDRTDGSVVAINDLDNLFGRIGDHAAVSADASCCSRCRNSQQR